MIRIFLWLWLLVGSAVSVYAGKVPDRAMLQKQLERLDQAIAQKQYYQEQRQHRIDSLLQLSRSCPPGQIVDYLKSAFNESSTFSGRQSLAILHRLDSIATVRHDINLHAWAIASQANTEATMGSFHTAFNLIRSINAQELDTETRHLFYSRAVSVLNWLDEFHRERDISSEADDMMRSYRDSLVNLEKQEEIVGINLASQYLDRKQYQEALRVCDEIENQLTGKDIIYLACVRGDAYSNLKQYIPSCYYMAEAAIDDMKSGVTDYMALPFMIHMLFDLGFHEESYRYLTCCMEDANLYPSNFMSLEANTIYPLVSSAYFQMEHEKSTRMIIFLVSAIIIIFVIVAGTIYNRMRMKNMKDLAQKNTELNQALRRAEASDKLKVALIHNISHEIRTPLNVINGFVQILTDKTMELDDGTKDDFSQEITKQTLHLTRMMNTIIQMAKYDNHDVEPNWQQVHVKNLLQECMGQCEDVKQLSVTLQMDCSLPDDYQLRSDGSQMSTILNGILNNACKFTQEGSITVGANLTENPGKLTLFIADTGKGIPAANAETIFERFTKLDEFVPGTGLGLPLCRAIALNLNAEVKLDTTYTQGARFVIVHPV